MFDVKENHKLPELKEACTLFKIVVIDNFLAFGNFFHSNQHHHYHLPGNSSKLSIRSLWGFRKERKENAYKPQQEQSDHRRVLAHVHHGEALAQRTQRWCLGSLEGPEWALKGPKIVYSQKGKRWKIHHRHCQKEQFMALFFSNPLGFILHLM